MKFLGSLKLFLSIIAIASVGLMKEGLAASKQVIATPDGIIIKEVPVCSVVKTPSQKASAKTCSVKTRSVYQDS